jgi:hypothetical protein
MISQLFFQTRKKLLILGSRMNNKTFSASELTRKIRRQFSAKEFVFTTRRDYAVDVNSIIVGGFYDSSNDQASLPCIEINLHYHPEQDMYLANQLEWDRISFDIAECVSHEMIHRLQFQKSKKIKKYTSLKNNTQDREDQEYLGSSDELEAYGFSIAAESFVYQAPLSECAMHRVYTKTFDNDNGIITQLEKHINKYTKELELS